jgi:SNF2 family DNA or RNA helicase
MNQICKWDVMVVDEGHRAKNVATKLRKALKEFIVSKQKIILTGTPVQNNLEEFYSIIDLV